MRTLMLVLLSAVCAPALAASPSAPAAASTSAAANPKQVKLQLREYFFDAAREGRQDMLAEFIRSHYDLNTRDEKGYTALILAAYHGQRPAVEQLLSAGADPCAQDKRGNTALMGAIFKGELGIAKRLMQADCAPDQRNNAGQTAAMYAALFQRTDVLKDLAAKGADLSLKDGQGNDVTKLQRGEFATAPAR
ncbi:ankyrin repeat domain-containing protein [Xanthomonas cannabis]|uniref:ankyrin repeat domain-containing protein n=1 Tax=Xanthomonas cannabis TaxID=1885674 RepID=UPI0033A958EC